MMVKKKQFISKFAIRQNIFGYVFLAPWLIGFLVLTAWPFLYTVFLSFHHVMLTIEGWDISYVGIDNYHLALFRNVVFVPALISFTIMLLTYVPAITVIAFMLALLLNQNIKFRGLFRALFFMPVIVMSGPVMFQLRLSGGLEGATIEGTALFIMIAQFSLPIANALAFLFENYATVLWFTGIPIVLFLTGLQKIDEGILEAARIDSATPWQILWKITIPIIKPIAMVSVILTIVQLAGYTENPVLPMINDAIHLTASGLGLASTFAWIYAFLVLALIGIAFWFLRTPKDVTPPEQKRRAMAWNER